MLHPVFVIIFIQELYHGVRSGTTHNTTHNTLGQHTPESTQLYSTRLQEALLYTALHYT